MIEGALEGDDWRCSWRGWLKVLLKGMIEGALEEDNGLTRWKAIGNILGAKKEKEGN
jgi:hypothetical protein